MLLQTSQLETFPEVNDKPGAETFNVCVCAPTGNEIGRRTDTRRCWLGYHRNNPFKTFTISFSFFQVVLGTLVSKQLVLESYNMTVIDHIAHEWVTDYDIFLTAKKQNGYHLRQVTSPLHIATNCCRSISGPPEKATTRKCPRSFFYPFTQKMLSTASLSEKPLCFRENQLHFYGISNPITQYRHIIYITFILWLFGMFVCL